MTNREYLATLDDYHFSQQIIAAVSELQYKAYMEYSNIYDIDLMDCAIDVEFELSEWLMLDHVDIV